MSIEKIVNYLHVSERIASSGQPDDSQFKAIAEAGYKVVINLAMPDSENAIPEEGNIVTTLKMVYIHIPVPFEAPNIAHLKCFIKTMNAFSEDKVWVHCVLNYRVSAFLYQYWRMVYGATLGEARKVMLPSWNPDEVWQQFMRIDPNEIAY